MFSEVFLFLIHAKKTPCIPEDILHQCVSCILRLWSSCVREFHILSVVKISRYMLLWDKKNKVKRKQNNSVAGSKFNWWRWCLALCNESFYHFSLFDEIFRHMELCNSIVSQIQRNPSKLFYKRVSGHKNNKVPGMPTYIMYVKISNL